MVVAFRTVINCVEIMCTSTYHSDLSTFQVVEYPIQLLCCIHTIDIPKLYSWKRGYLRMFSPVDGMQVEMDEKMRFKPSLCPFNS